MMAQQLKVLAAVPECQSPIPGTHVLEQTPEGWPLPLHT